MAYETTDKSDELKKCYEKLWFESLKSYYCKCDDDYTEILKAFLAHDKKIYDIFIDEIFKDYNNIYNPNYSAYYDDLLSKMRTNFGKTICKNIYLKFSGYFDHKKKLDSYISKQNELENDYRIVTLVIMKLKEEDVIIDKKIFEDEKETQELKNKIINLSKEKHKCCQDQILNFQNQLNETINSFLSKRIRGFDSELLLNGDYREKIIKQLNFYKDDYLKSTKEDNLSSIISFEKEIIEKKQSFNFDKNKNDIIEKMKRGDYVYKKLNKTSDGKKKKSKKKKNKSKKKSKKKNKYKNKSKKKL